MNRVNIGSDNGLSPGRRQAIIWTNAAINCQLDSFSEIWIGILPFSFKKIHLNMSFATMVATLSRGKLVKLLRYVRLRTMDVISIIRRMSNRMTKEACDNDDVIKWKHFPRDWPLVRRIYRPPVNSTITQASDAELWCFLWSVPE